MQRPLLAIMALATLTTAGLPQSPPPLDASASYLASAFSDWKTGRDGVARMNLVGDSTNPTGLSAFRLRYSASAGDSTKAQVHFHMGTEHILVLKGTYVVGFGEKVDYAA